MQNLFSPDISAMLFILLHDKPTKPQTCKGCAGVSELRFGPKPCLVGHSCSVTPAWPAAPVLCIVCHMQALQTFIPAVLVCIQYVPVVNDFFIKGSICAISNRDVVDECAYNAHCLLSQQTSKNFSERESILCAILEFNCSQDCFCMLDTQLYSQFYLFVKCCSGHVLSRQKIFICFLNLERQGAKVMT